MKVQSVRQKRVPVYNIQHCTVEKQEVFGGNWARAVRKGFRVRKKGEPHRGQTAFLASGKDFP